jgi:hypothetical protein
VRGRKQRLRPQKAEADVVELLSGLAASEHLMNSKPAAADFAIMRLQGGRGSGGPSNDRISGGVDAMLIAARRPGVLIQLELASVWASMHPEFSL